MTEVGLVHSGVLQSQEIIDQQKSNDFTRTFFQAGKLQTIKNSVSCSDSWSRYCERPGRVIWWLWCMEHADWGISGDKLRCPAVCWHSRVSSSIAGWKSEAGSCDRCILFPSGNRQLPCSTRHPRLAAEKTGVLFRHVYTLRHTCPGSCLLEVVLEGEALITASKETTEPNTCLADHWLCSVDCVYSCDECPAKRT